MNLDDYHALGRAMDPRDAVLSASMLMKGFNPHPRADAHPWATLQLTVGGPQEETYDMLAGWLLHLLLLDRLEPKPIDPKVATWTATGLGKSGKEVREVSIEGTVRLGEYLIGPAVLKPANHLVGGEQRRVLLQLAGELGLKIAGSAYGDLDTDGMTMARRAYVEAAGIHEWLTACPPEDQPSHLPASAQEALRRLDTLARREQSYFAEIDGLKVRARPDGETEDGGLVNLKRTAFAHPSRFWTEADKAGWWASEAFYELVMCASDDPRDEDLVIERPWTIIAISPPTKRRPPQAFVYEASEKVQAAARQQVEEMLKRYRECLETRRWEAPEERLPVQPPPHWLADDEVPWEEMDDEDEPGWDPGENAPQIEGVEPR